MMGEKSHKFVGEKKIKSQRMMQIVEWDFNSLLVSS